MFFDSNVKHSWANFESDPDRVLPCFRYLCRCGNTYGTHEELMDHTAEANPIIESYELGRAGVAIERESHEKTLARLKTATAPSLAIMELAKALRDCFRQTNGIIPTGPLDELIARYVSDLEPHEETGRGD